MDDKQIRRMAALETYYWFWVTKRFLFFEMTKKYLKKNVKRVLDVGCGTGGILYMIKDFFPKGTEIYGVDKSAEAIQICKKRANHDKLKFNLKVGDAEKVPYKDNYFDLIIASDILEHVPDDKKAASEIHRVLKKGGYAFITVPMYKHLFGTDDIRLHHIRRYSKKRLNSLFGGFKIVRQTYIHSFFYLPAVILRLIERKAKKSRSFEEVLKDNIIVYSYRTPLGSMIEYLRVSKFFFLNWTLRKINSFENRLIMKGVDFPAGVGMFTILRKV